jgi:hypothetical protein
VTRSRRSPADQSNSPERANQTDAAPASGPNENDIARRAFERYCERGCEDGHHVEDWLEAERELRQSNATDERPGSER